MGDGAPRPHPHGRRQRVRPCAQPAVSLGSPEGGAAPRLLQEGNPAPGVVARLLPAVRRSHCLPLTVAGCFSGPSFCAGKQSFLTVFPVPRPALSRSCPSRGALLGAQPHSVPTGSRAAGGDPHSLPVEGGPIRAVHAPSQTRSLPHKHARPAGLGDALTGVCGPPPAALPPGSGPRLAGRGCQHGLPGD